MTSQAFFSPPPSSLLNIPTSKSKTLYSLSLNTQPPFLEPSKTLKRTTFNPRKTTPFSFPHISQPINSKSSAADSISAATVDNPISSSTPTSSSSEQNDDELTAAAGAKIGARIRVKVPLKVYHIPKVPEFDLNGKIGKLKQYVGVHKGRPISANLPYKVEFVEDNVEGRDGPVRFLAHLKEDEFEYID